VTFEVNVGTLVAMDQNRRAGSCPLDSHLGDFSLQEFSAPMASVYGPLFCRYRGDSNLAILSFLLTAQGCESHGVLIVSPDGRHAARMMIYGNVPGGTSVWVIARRSWSPLSEEVASGSSIGTLLDPIEPTIVWEDNSHLILDFPATDPGDSSYRHLCQNKQVGDILVVCKTHIRKQ
jgi:hypothetical protein